ncbi:MAG: phenylalanine--tRNA ligase subunit alpha [Defluviitaleaceae bacterium]|nr:phenylalanine--tRNA ligase subunit alpha [Defluviitaleaceae bacterium]
MHDDDLMALSKKFDAMLEVSDDPAALENLRLFLLGKKGELTALLKTLSAMEPDERRAFGQKANEFKNYAENKLDEARRQNDAKQIENALGLEKIDVTRPGRRRPVGRKHPLTQVLGEMKDLFVGMGFTIEEGPEIEKDYYNFEALNIPANHPVKDIQDTFYIDGQFVLRTHTSPVQVRVMEKRKPPIRIIAPGAVYRADDWDATHSPMFHQLEGMLIDKNITFGDLKGMLIFFAKKLLGEDVGVRFRPSFFPFTEPSAEMDVACYSCGGGGRGCRVCKESGWVELLGCGMIHPNVLSMSGIDPAEYTGWAFGMGPGRITTARFNIPDTRLLFENDMQFLNQFNRP